MENHIDFSRLLAPAGHGDVLIEPAAHRLAALAGENRRLLDDWQGALGGVPLSEARTSLRTALGLDDRPVIVTGHQPEFIHAGVWAKHVVAVRLAQAVGGTAVNLVVDHDAPRAFAFAVPRIEGRRVQRTWLRYADWPAGAALEGAAAMPAADVHRLRDETARALGTLYDQSLLPAFWQACADAADAADWVDQAVRARRAAEHALGVRLQDERVSARWYGPWLSPLLADADRFAEAYNSALSDYRVRERIRGHQRPMPDLHCANDFCETALWVYRPGEPRRRLFVRRRGSDLELLADDERIAAWPMNEVARWSGLAARLDELGNWRIRPRALALTLWARVLLADLFIHGIGGAKYDRITDEIIRRYFHRPAPAMACVSATLRLPLDIPNVTAADVGRAWQTERDLRYNPQRHLPEPAVRELAEHKRALIATSQRLRKEDPRNARARRDTYHQLRAANTAMLAHDPTTLSCTQQHARDLERALQDTEAATDRTYFFAMMPRHDLEALLDKLPDVTTLRAATIV